MIISNLEQIHEITIWSPIVERWELKWEPEKYLRMYIKFLTFRDADLSYLKPYSEDLIGKTDTDFIQWLISQSKAEETSVQLGNPIFYFIDNTFPGNYNDSKMEQYFVEDSQRNIPLGSQELDDLMFEMGWRESDSQPSELLEKIFPNEQNALNSMIDQFSFFKVIQQPRDDGF